MNRLPKEHAKLLYELIPHDRDFLYLKARLEGVSFDDARREYLIIRSLEDRGMLYCNHRTFVVEHPSAHVDGAIEGFECPVGFTVTADGLAYRKERRKDALLWLGGSVVTAVLCGFFAWVFTIVFPA